MKNKIKFYRTIFNLNKRYASTTINKTISKTSKPIDINYKFNFKNFNNNFNFNEHKFRVLGGLFGAIALSKNDKYNDYLKIFLGGCIGYIIPGTTIILSGTTFFNQYKHNLIK